LIRYETSDVWRELTYLAYHLHWDLEDLLDLDHRDRGTIIDNVASLNERAWEEVRSLG